MQQSSKKHSSGILLLYGVFCMIICIAIDQIAKYLAVLHLKNAAAVPVIPEVFELSYLENHGAAFGILQGQKIFLIIMTLIALMLLIYLYIHIPVDKHYRYIRFILILFISGAIGNFIDRCRQDYVIDFFYFKLIDFPVFNVADIYVTLAAFLLVVLFCFYYKEEDIDRILETLPFWKKKEKC